MRTLSEIKAEVQFLAARLGALEAQLPAYGQSRDGGLPHVEIHEGRYHYVVAERGEELKRLTTPDLDELLFWIFSDVTHVLAFSYELTHRVEGQDCRRLAFPKQIALLGRISTLMAARRASEIEGILVGAPYDDEPTRRVDQLRCDAT